jgi:hypothetical protein
MFVATFKSSYSGTNNWKPHGRELDDEYIYVIFYLVVLNNGLDVVGSL